MTRAELAKELLKCLGIVARAGMTVSYPFEAKLDREEWDRVLKGLSSAATLLEEEERDARRFRVLKESLLCHLPGYWWRIQRLFNQNLLLEWNYKERDGWYSTLDAALDAWLEEREKEDADSQG